MTDTPVAQPLSAAERLDGWIESLTDRGDGLVWTTKAELRAMTDWLMAATLDAARSVPDGDGDPATFCDICDETCECEPIPVAPAGLDDHHHPDTLCPICRYWYVALASPEEPR